jgi:hypothetical protein
MTEEPAKIAVDLSGDGLLWLINRVVFHPRGFALAYSKTDGSCQLWGNGDEPWKYQLGEGEESRLFLASQAVMARVTAESTRDGAS